VVPTDIVDRLVQLQTWLEGRVERERALVDLLNLWLSWCTDIHGDPATEPSDYIVNETRAALGLPPRDELPAELPEDLPEKVHIRVYGNGEWAWLDDLGSSPWPDARTFVASLPREAWREVAR
jgi:hypothetical protein